MALLGIQLPPASDVDANTEAEKALVKTVLSLHEDASKYKDERTGPWREVYEFVRGRHWKARPGWRASPRSNLVFSKLQFQLAQLTDNRPVSNLMPRFPQFKEYADSVQVYYDYEWDRDDVDTTVEDVTVYKLMWSVGFYHTYWDSVNKKPHTEAVDPHRIFTDRRATDVENARFLIRTAQMSRGEIEQRWPKARRKRQFIRPGVAIVDEPEKRDPGDITSGRSYKGLGATAQVTELVPRSYEMQTSDSPEIQVLDCWIRDSSVAESYLEMDSTDPEYPGKVPVTDSEGNAVRSFEPIYPSGRHIVIAGGAVVHDAPNEYDHGEFPYVAQFCHRVPGELWCISFLENLIEPQRMVNKMYGILMESAALSANAQWRYPRGSLDDAAVLTGEQGMRFEYNAQPGIAPPERLPGLPAPAFLIHVLEMARRDMDDISGSHDVSEGRKPSGITAGVAIESLQEAGQTRIRPLVRHLEKAVKKVSEQRFALMQQFMDEAKTIRITDDETGQEKYLQVTPEMIRGQFEVEVVPGSSLPKNRDARFRQALGLKKEGVFDEQAVLEYTDHPYAHKILKRLADRRKKAMEIALQTNMQPSQIDPGAFANAVGGEAPQGPPVEGPEPMRKPQVDGRGGGFYNQEGS